MISVWVTHQHESLHYWPAAKEPVEFLKHPHRHLMHIKLEVNVNNPDREVEFLQLKRELINFCVFRWPYGFVTTHSCEQIAFEVYVHFKCIYSVVEIQVSEDGENGATLRP